MSAFLSDRFHSHDSLSSPILNPFISAEDFYFYFDPRTANPEAVKFAESVFSTSSDSETLESSNLSNGDTSEEFVNLNKQIVTTDAKISATYERFQKSCLLSPPSLSALGENRTSSTVTVESVSSSTHSSSTNNTAFTNRSTAEEIKSSVSSRKRKSSDKMNVSKVGPNHEKIIRISTSSAPQKSIITKLGAEDIEELRKLCKLHTTGPIDNPRRDVQAIKKDFFQGTRQQLWALFEPKKGQRSTLIFGRFLIQHIYKSLAT